MLTIFSLVLSIITCFTMWLAGNHDRRAWVLGLCNQGLWIALIIWTGTWGLLLLTGALIFIYLRNLIKWTPGPEEDYY